jgi:hypothetical protein
MRSPARDVHAENIVFMIPVPNAANALLSAERPQYPHQ